MSVEKVDSQQFSFVISLDSSKKDCGKKICLEFQWKNHDMASVGVMWQDCFSLCHMSLFL